MSPFFSSIKMSPHFQEKGFAAGRWSESAEAGEIEADGDGVTFRGNDFDGDSIGSEGGDGKFQINGSASRTARASAPAAVERVASRIGRRKDLVTVRHLHAKVSPEIIRARDERRRRGRS